MSPIHAMKAQVAQLHPFLTTALDVGWVFSLVPQQVYIQDPMDPGLRGPRPSLNASKQTRNSYPCHESNHNSSNIKPVV